jgi:hypothetical protein
MRFGRDRGDGSWVKLAFQLPEVSIEPGTVKSLVSVPQVDFRVRSLEVLSEEGCRDVHLLELKHGQESCLFPFQDHDLRELKRVLCPFEPVLFGSMFKVKLENRGEVWRKPVIRVHIEGREPIMVAREVRGLFRLLNSALRVVRRSHG